MSDHLGVHLSDQVRVGGPPRGIEVVCWGSTEALEAVKRVCQDVAVRCHRAVTTHCSVDAADEQLGAGP